MQGDALQEYVQLQSERFSLKEMIRTSKVQLEQLSSKIQKAEARLVDV